MFTLICTGRIYGMESQPLYDTLPKELQDELVNTALATNKSVDDVVNTIKALGSLYRVPYNTQAAINLFMKTLPNDLHKAINAVKNLQGTKPEDFTKLVHILANKFNTTTAKIAITFNTPTAQQYINLWTKAKDLPDTNTLAQLIENGLDVNVTYGPDLSSLLIKTLELGCTSEKTKKRVILLLDAGANPHYKNRNGQTALYWAILDLGGYNAKLAEEIKQLLENASAVAL